MESSTARGGRPPAALFSQNLRYNFSARSHTLNGEVNHSFLKCLTFFKSSPGCPGRRLGGLWAKPLFQQGFFQEPERMTTSTLINHLSKNIIIYNYLASPLRAFGSVQCDRDSTSLSLSVKSVILSAWACRKRRNCKIKWFEFLSHVPFVNTAISKSRSSLLSNECLRGNGTCQRSV